MLYQGGDGQEKMVLASFLCASHSLYIYRETLVVQSKYLLLILISIIQSRYIILLIV